MTFVDRSTIKPEVRGCENARFCFKSTYFLIKQSFLFCSLFLCLFFEIWYVTKHLFTETSGDIVTL